MKKSELASLAQKNNIAAGIAREIARKETFILTGHMDPDMDCVASLITMALLLRKAKKEAVIYLPGPVAEHFNYLFAICKAHGVLVMYGGGLPLFLTREPRRGVTAIFILDTPKPEMISLNDAIAVLMEDARVRRIEIDHHLAADALYAGDEGYCLVTAASSTCELLCYLGYKMAKQFGWKKDSDILSRNIYLAILTGIIGDSNMGRYLKTRREKWYYETVNTRFHGLLGSIVPKGTGFATEDMFDIIYTFSVQDRRCYDSLMALAHESKSVFYIALSKDVSQSVIDQYGTERMVTVSKVAADTLAEQSGRLGLVVYHDDDRDSGFVQCRLRRSSIYGGIDLRIVLEKLKIGNGGGHPGAIGFRIPKTEIKNFDSYTEKMVESIEKLLEPAAKARV
ncbi:MAG: DHH family phosphoesterase [Spirochaetaceae bacterium]|nr:DHH family phosphoesterase [Spirochaetaceae bacterium]